MISVIIPVYNGEEYLRRCLDSVLASDYPGFEVVLVDDGSTDASPAICAEYARRDGRVRLIRQENQGVSAARNAGLDACRGEWVTFVDADDLIAPSFLGLIAREEYRDQDFILFDFARNLEELAAAPPPETLFLEREEMPELFRCIFQRRQLIPGRNANYIGVSAKVFRKSLLDCHSIRYHPRLFFGEDALFNIEYLAKTERFAYTPVPVYYYYFHPDSSSRRFQPELPEMTTELLREVQRVLEENRLFPLVENEFYTYTLDTLGYALAWSVFSPDSPNSHREKVRLCRVLREDELYANARKYVRNYHWSSRILLCLFYLRWYCAAGLVAGLGSRYLSWKNRR